MQNPYRYEVGQLCCEETPLAAIAEAAGTPAYVYSKRAILERYRAYDGALAGIPHTVCYAVKANSNLAILRLLAEAGAGFDIVSGGELYRVLQAGGDPGKIVFSGVGKTPAEFAYALECGLRSFNCESEGELSVLDELAGERGQKVQIALRVNPDVDAATHPYISTGMSEHKFGIDMREVESVYQYAASLPNLDVAGVSCHIGSQLLDSAPLLEAVDKVLALVDRLTASGLQIRHLDVGGGLGVAYRPQDRTPGIANYLEQLRERLAERRLHLLLEPGRSIVGEAGALLTRVLYRKQTPKKEFLIVDAAMNDLMRPALYQSHHEIIPVRKMNGDAAILADVVGPVCETGDFLAKNRQMAAANPGDLMAVMTAGAYGFSLSSNYNSRMRAAEVLVDGATWRVIRERETLADLVRGEQATTAAS